MKLKLEVHEKTVYLTVTDIITPQHISVLKAGLNKLFIENKKTIVLDFSGMPNSAFQPLEVIQEISGLQVWAAEQGAQIIIASAIEGWGDTRSAQAASQLLDSPAGRLLALENRLRLQLSKLEAHKIELEKRITTLDGSTGDALSLRRENGDLKRRVAEAEHQIKARLDARTPVHATPEVRQKMSANSRTLISILEREGLLPVT